MSAAPKKPVSKHLNIALQGGGAHGAYAWGILDYLAEDGRINIDGMSGTSAGAMNAVVYSYGMMKGGPDQARKAMEDFWWDVSRYGAFLSPVKKSPFFSEFWGIAPIQALTYSLFDTITRTFSPYQFNPANFNPLKDILEKHVNFEELDHCKDTKMFVCATNVRTGNPHIFTNETLTSDAVLASACLPFLFQAVEIDGESYWDGGYTGNPALYPLIYKTVTRDFLVVHINPMERKQIPNSAAEIMNRLNEITFNASLVKEMRAISFVQKLIHQDWLKDEYKDNLKAIRMHAIRADQDMQDFDVSTKFSSDWDFLTDLKNRGRKHAKAWLHKNFDKIGNESTIDIHAEYL